MGNLVGQHYADIQSEGYKALKNLDAHVYGLCLKHLILPLGDLMYGQQMMKRLAFLQDAQWWSRDKIYHYRDQLLQKTIYEAYEVPFYRDLMKRHGISPNDIGGYDDLKHMPIVTKSMLRAQFPHNTTRETGQKTYNACSSGSTGEPFCVKEDNYTAGWYRASFMLALHWAGWRIGEPHLQTGMTLVRDRGRRIKDLLLVCQYESAYDLTDEHLDHMLNLLINRKLRHLWGYPGSLYHLAKRAIETGKTTQLTSVVTWGDMVFPSFRNAIEQAFGIQVTDTYGCAEGIQVSAQCEGSSYYLVHNFDVIVEYLDDQGNPVPVGEPGHLILTRLHAGPMPLIRYRVGDMAVSGGDRKPACGRGLEIMENIQGRDTDIIMTPSGNRLIVHFFTGILEHYTEIKSFQIVQHKLDEIVLRVIPGEGFNAAVANRVIQQLRERGADVAIKLELVDQIPLNTGGKRRFVISHLSPKQISQDKDL